MLTKIHYVKPGARKRKATSPAPQEEELDQEIRDLEAIHQQVQKKKEKMLRGRCVISPKMTKTEGLNTESFVKTTRTTMMNGMRISIMAILLLMMLLL
jgi:hypothetical protein